MNDKGHDETEKVLKEIENQISKEYAQAEKEISAKLDDYLEKFRAKDELKRKALENGLITEQEYKQWRVGQIMMGQRWAEMRDTIAKDLTNADKIARSIAFEHMPEVYAINHDYGTFQVEKASKLDTSYTLYDRNAMEQLVKNEDTFIPAPGRKVTRDIKEGKALAWNKKQVQSAMMQSLLQGESIGKIATRLSKTVGESDRKAAIRNARTMTTGVENAGRVESYRRANDMGIQTQKQWKATFDNRTRHWHAELDWEVADYDEPFHNEYGDIMFPGDPTADPANIYNCRCTLEAAIKGFPRENPNKGLFYEDELGKISYDDWKAGHYDQNSHPITHQDTISEIMEWKHKKEYQEYENSGKEDLKEHKKSDIISLDQLDVVRYDDVDSATTTEELKALFPNIAFDEDFSNIDYNAQKEFTQGLRYMQETFGDDALPKRIKVAHLPKDTSAKVSCAEKRITLNDSLTELDAYVTAVHECTHLFDDIKGEIGEDVINEALRMRHVRKNGKLAVKEISDTIGQLTYVKYKGDYSEQLAWSFEYGFRKERTAFAESVKDVMIRRYSNGRKK